MDTEILKSEKGFQLSKEMTICAVIMNLGHYVGPYYRARVSELTIGGLAPESNHPFLRFPSQGLNDQTIKAEEGLQKVL